MVSRRSIGMRGTTAVAVAATAWLVGLGAASGVIARSAGSGPSGGVTSRVSVGPGGVQAKGGSFGTSISRSGRYVAFASGATNLVAGDTNRRPDVFVRDRVAHVTRRVSVGPRGAQVNGSSYEPAISADGRFVAFSSNGSNLVAGDTNRLTDVFVRDLVAHVTRRVSVGPGGAEADGGSSEPAISGDGQYVAFTSDASNLVAGETNLNFAVFVRDRVAHVTERVSVGPGGAQPNSSSTDPAISADGQSVAFTSDASNLVAGDTNGSIDVFVRDRKAQVTRRVSVGPGAAQANLSSREPAISAGGRYVAFSSEASNLVAGDTNASADVFVRDRAAHVTRRVSVGPGGAQANSFSIDPAISLDGRFVAFVSPASNLVARENTGIYDVYVRDRVAHVTRRVSVGRLGADANANSASPSVAGGRSVAFSSDASNLVARDTNEKRDVFVRDLAVG